MFISMGKTTVPCFFEGLLLNKKTRKSGQTTINRQGQTRLILVLIIEERALLAEQRPLWTARQSAYLAPCVAALNRSIRDQQLGRLMRGRGRVTHCDLS